MNLPNAVVPERSRVSVANGSARRGADSGLASGSEAVPDPFSRLLAEVFRKSDILSKLSAPPGESADAESPGEPRGPIRGAPREDSREEEPLPGSEGMGCAPVSGAGWPPDPLPAPPLTGGGPEGGAPSTDRLQGPTADAAGAGTAAGTEVATRAGEGVPTPGEGRVPDVSSQAVDPAGAQPDSGVASGWIESSSMRSLITRSSELEAALPGVVAAATAGAGGGGEALGSSVGIDPSTPTDSEADPSVESIAVEHPGDAGRQGIKGLDEAGGREASGGDDSGTSGADKEGAMLAETMMNETSGSGGQELPSGSEFSVAAQGPESEVHRESRDLSGGSEQPMATVTPGWAVDAGPDREVRAGSSALADAGRAERVERLAGLTEAAVVQFRRMEGGAYEVSIRPDDATEIRLSVSLGEGAPEVRAELRRGDAATFAAQWPDLQARLSQQGIRLLPNPSVAGSLTGSGSGPHPGPGREQRQESASNSFEPRRMSSGTRDLTVRSTPARFTGGRGWETWA